MTKARFRLLVVAWFVLYVWLFTLPSSAYKQPPDIREILAYSGRGATIPPNDSVAYLLLGASFAAAVGLVGMQLWARRLLVAIVVAMGILRGFRGISVATPPAAILSLLYTLMTGAILTLIYTAPLSERFAATPDPEPVWDGIDGPEILVWETDDAREARAILALLESAGVPFTTSDDDDEDLGTGPAEEGSVDGPYRFFVHPDDVRAARAVLSLFRMSGANSWPDS
jgi:hypothetical protein